MDKQEPKQRLEKYSERFDNKDNEIVKGIFNPETWGKRIVQEPNYNMKQEILDEMEKQETLEEGFYRIRKSIDYEEFDFTSFELGAKWQQQNSYSGEDMKQFGDWCRNGLLNTEYGFEKLDEHLEQWKQLKNK